MRIPTFDASGQPNGHVLPLWSELTEPGLRPAQVYVTALAPGTRKGPHLHKERRGVFHCVHGTVLVRKFCNGAYVDKVLTPGDGYVFVARGDPAALYNVGDGVALVVNMPNPAWSKENPDEWPVEKWEDPTCVS